MAIVSGTRSPSSNGEVHQEHHAAVALWSAQAPDALSAIRSCRDDAGWKAWRKYLRHREQPRDISRRFKCRHSPLRWSLTGDAHSPTATLLAELYSGGKKGAPQAISSTDIEAWLAVADSRPVSTAAALEYLAWAWALPRLARHVSANLWWQLLEQLVRTSGEAAGLDRHEEPLAHQLLAGELSLTLARQFPELTMCHARAAAGHSALERGLPDLVDDRGLADAAYGELLRPLLGCWARSRKIAAELEVNLSDDADAHYWTAVWQALRLTRFDGTLALTTDRKSEPAEMFATALHGGPREMLQAAAECLPPNVRLPAPKRRAKRLPSPAWASEPARLAVLRRTWSRRSELLAVRYAGRTVETELHLGRERIWSGTWRLKIRAAGRLAEAASDWEEVCWFSDDDVDYLELECRLEQGLRVQRQFLLSRSERISILADAVFGVERQDLQYCSTLPLLPGVAYRGADETREGRITVRKQQALLLPLALPEWRSDPRGGTLGLTDDGLELRQSASGRALYAPIFFDLDRSRRKKPFTWRRLTVGDERAVQPADVACGYRVQIGTEQWLVYRSLQPRRARTVLGHHVNTDFLFGRFTRDGQVEQLLEVE